MYKWLFLSAFSVLPCFLRAQFMGTPITLDGASAMLGQFNSLQIVNGKPAISYYEESTGLKYIRANNVSGTSWGTPVLAHTNSPNIVGPYTSLQVVNGRPAISYWDETQNYLRFVRANDANGDTWATSIVVDATNNVGYFTTLQVVNGNPAISYWDLTNNLLKYVRANDANGTSWGTPVVVDKLSGVGYYTSMLVVNGKPCIAFYNHTSGDLKFVRADDANGDTWATPQIIDNAPEDVGAYPSLQIVNGNPAVSYSNNSESKLKYIRATNTDGTAWASPLVVDESSTVGQFSSLQIVKGKPTISYYETGYGNLRYVSANDANGTSWGIPVILEAMGNVGQFTSLLMVNGEPAISYYDATQEDLKFIRSAELIVLPVELTSFDAKAVNETCLLTWQTIQETHIQGFYVQKTSNTTDNWRDLGFVKAYGKPSIYQFTDENRKDKSVQPQHYNGATYYRLLQVNTDGKRFFSKTISFFFDKNGAKMVVSPSNTEGVIRITNADWDLPITDITVFNAVGQLVFHKKANSHSETIDLSARPSGMYIVQGMIGGELFVEKVLNNFKSK